MNIEKRLERLEAQQPGRLKRIIPLLSAFIAVLALIANVWTSCENKNFNVQQLHLSRTHNRLSVKPKLLFKTRGPLLEHIDFDEEIYIRIANNGIGPAIITNIQLFYSRDGTTFVELEDWPDFFEEFGIQYPFLNYQGLGHHSLKDGDVEDLLWIDRKALERCRNRLRKFAKKEFSSSSVKGDKAQIDKTLQHGLKKIVEAMGSIKLLVSYESIYGESDQIELCLACSNKRLKKDEQ